MSAWLSARAQSVQRAACNRQQDDANAGGCNRHTKNYRVMLYKLCAQGISRYTLNAAHASVTLSAHGHAHTWVRRWLRQRSGGKMSMSCTSGGSGSPSHARTCVATCNADATYPWSRRTVSRARPVPTCTARSHVHGPFPLARPVPTCTARSHLHGPFPLARPVPTCTARSHVHGPFPRAARARPTCWNGLARHSPTCAVSLAGFPLKEHTARSVAAPAR